MTLGEEIYADEYDVAALLHADASGEFVRDMSSVLRQRRAALKAAMDKGVPVDEFQKMQALLAAYDAAATGLEKAWKKRHAQ